MKSKTIGLLMLATLSFATSVVTSQVIHRLGFASQVSAAPLDEAEEEIHSERTEERIGAGAPDMVLGKHQVRINAPFASAHMDIKRLAPAPGGFEIEAIADLVNHKRDRALVWQLSVLESGVGDLLWRQRYDHQVFLDAKGTETNPSFTDKITMPSGEYFVLIELLEVPPAGVSALNGLPNGHISCKASDAGYVLIP